MLFKNVIGVKDVSHNNQYVIMAIGVTIDIYVTLAMIAPKGYHWTLGHIADLNGYNWLSKY